MRLVCKDCKDECQECFDDVCEHPTTFGCYTRDYDCDYGCNACTDEDGYDIGCKYEEGELGASIYAFNELVRKGEVKYNPFIGGSYRDEKELEWIE